MDVKKLTLTLCMLLGLAAPALASYDAAYIALQKKDYGESYSVFSTFGDVIKVVVPVALLKAKPPSGNACEAAKDVNLLKFNVSGPLSGAQYLPADANALKDF